MFDLSGVGGRGVGATYAVHIRLIGKPMFDFPLVIIALFSLGVTAEPLRANNHHHHTYNLTKGVGEKSVIGRSLLSTCAMINDWAGRQSHAYTPYQLIWHTLVTAVKLLARGINTYR